jgi:endoglucanase
LNWVEVDDLEVHIEVAALTVMRVSPSLLVTDLNKDGRVNIQDITMVAVAFGSKPGDADWNVIADLDKNGVVNILDITMVAKDYGKT